MKKKIHFLKFCLIAQIRIGRECSGLSLLPSVRATQQHSCLDEANRAILRRDYCACGTSVNTGNGAKQKNPSRSLPNYGIDADIYPLHQFSDVLAMAADNSNAVFLLRREFRILLWNHTYNRTPPTIRKESEGIRREWSK